MSEWVLIMTISFYTNGGGGAGIETMKFDNEKQCMDVASVFLNRDEIKSVKAHSYNDYGIKTNLDAVCVEIKK